MDQVPFTKPPLSYEDQISQLIQRGLKIDDIANAQRLLKHLSYYRLSGYWHPFLIDDKKSHKFKEGSTFELAFKLYCFDKHLRKLVFSEIEKIEIAIRAQLIYEFSHEHGIFWLNNKDLFKDSIKYDRMMNEIDHAYAKSDEIFIKSFKNNYSDPYPPSWILLEIVSFGTISQIYSNLTNSRLKRRVANFFALNDYTFQRWIHTLTYARNVCAHHTRLWNRTMRIDSVLLDSPRMPWLKNEVIRTNKFYYIMCIILYFHYTVHPNNKFREKFMSLLDEYDNVHITALGFPENWRDEPIWT